MPDPKEFNRQVYDEFSRLAASIYDGTPESVSSIAGSLLTLYIGYEAVNRGIAADAVSAELAGELMDKVAYVVANRIDEYKSAMGINRPVEPQ